MILFFFPLCGCCLLCSFLFFLFFWSCCLELSRVHMQSSRLLAQKNSYGLCTPVHRISSLLVVYFCIYLRLFIVLVWSERIIQKGSLPPRICAHAHWSDLSRVRIRVRNCSSPGHGPVEIPPPSDLALCTHLRPHSMSDILLPLERDKVRRSIYSFLVDWI